MHLLVCGHTLKDSSDSLSWTIIASECDNDKGENHLFEKFLCWWLIGTWSVQQSVTYSNNKSISACKCRCRLLSTFVHVLHDDSRQVPQCSKLLVMVITCFVGLFWKKGGLNGVAGRNVQKGEIERSFSRHKRWFNSERMGMDGVQSSVGLTTLRLLR